MPSRTVHLKSTWPGYAVYVVLALCHHDNEITGVQQEKIYFSSCFLRSPSIVAVNLCWGHKVWEMGSTKQKKLLHWSPGNKDRLKGVGVSTAPSRAQPCDLTPSHLPIPTCYNFCPAPNTATDYGPSLQHLGPQKILIQIRAGGSNQRQMAHSTGQK